MRAITIAGVDFEYDPSDPPGFRSGRSRLGPLLDATRLGASVYELPPGQAVCPYHYEYGEEEWLVVLEGHPTVRHPGGSDRLAPLDTTCFPVGPDGAHAIRNDTDETVRILMFSNVAFPTATAYPDSGKVGIWIGERDEDLMARRADGVDYWDGETGEGADRTADAPNP